MTGDSTFLESPVEHWPALGQEIGCELFVKRDDLLPFPLAGNKFRKLFAESRAARWDRGDFIISNGGIESNHCRTIAFMAARLGAHAHLVLHGSEDSAPSMALGLLRALGATYDVVESAAIRDTLESRASAARDSGRSVHMVAGGAHTPAGVRAYTEAAVAALAEISVDHVIVASGTGATQAGIVLGARAEHPGVQVTGISVARGGPHGQAAVMEAATWIDPAFDGPIDFDDRFVDGGYAQFGRETAAAVSLGWKRGLPLDTTYTGKALRGLIHKLDSGEIRRESRVLFWHTGGLAVALANGEAAHELRLRGLN